MNEPRAKRITRELTVSERERLEKYREQIARELPDLQARDQMRKDAREEGTLSGELRRAIHASELSLAEVAARVAVSPILLDDFLTGERTLRSDVIDRLATVLGCELNRVP
jgi:ribosome-binding protein aMBF1 (putative translation factor)